MFGPEESIQSGVRMHSFGAQRIEEVYLGVETGGIWEWGRGKERGWKLREGWGSPAPVLIDFPKGEQPLLPAYPPHPLLPSLLPIWCLSCPQHTPTVPPPCPNYISSHAQPCQTLSPHRYNSNITIGSIAMTNIIRCHASQQHKCPILPKIYMCTTAILKHHHAILTTLFSTSPYSTPTLLHPPCPPHHASCIPNTPSTPHPTIPIV